MIIVEGRIFCQPGTRDDFVRLSLEAVRAARGNVACLDFVVAPDPLDQDRVNIFEKWESLDALMAFREDGPGDDLASKIRRAEVHQHTMKV